MLKRMISQLLLYFFYFFPINTPPSNSTIKYAVIFDAGSTGSRVHVFAFDEHTFDLIPLAQTNNFEFFLSTKPGLSSYEKDPKSGAQSLEPLLLQAGAVVPKDLRPATPLRLGATAGLRMLSGNASEAILDAVKNLFKNESGLNYRAEWVSVLEGTQEGAYQWVTINYLLGSLGKDYSSTVGVVDLGGGSVQMAYAISDESAANAPDGGDEEAYVTSKLLMGSKYHLYSHSYLNYGLLAARAQSFELTRKFSSNPCVTNGFYGTYTYSGIVYNVTAPASGTSMRRCRALTRKVIQVRAPCFHLNCSFNGVWNGGGGYGIDNLYIGSSFYDTAAESGIISRDVPVTSVRPIDYGNAAKRACKANVDNIKSEFPLIDERDVGFLCMDLVYQYTLLVDGFGIDRFEEMKVLKQMEYKKSGSLLEAAWPLGCAVELLSSRSVFNARV